MTTPAPSVESVDSVWLGILLDPKDSTVVHDLGPYGGSAEVVISIIINSRISSQVLTQPTSHFGPIP